MMTGLETAFYIVGIVFMSLMLLIGLVLITAILVIRTKIVAIHKQIEDRVHSVSDWAEKGEAVVGALKKASKKVKR